MKETEDKNVLKAFAKALKRTCYAIIGRLAPAAAFIFMLTASAQAGNSCIVRAISDPYPPGAITGMRAMPGDNVGEIKIIWHAPGDNGNKDKLKPNIYPHYCPFVYEMKLSVSSPEEFGGLNEDWWKLSPSTYTELISDALDPGSEEERIIKGLKPGVTYWIGIKARDKVGNWSKDLNVVGAMAQWEHAPPAAISNLAAQTGYNQVALYWTAPGDDGTTGTADYYMVKYATYFITQSDFDSVKLYKTRKVTKPGGIPDGEIITGLTGDMMYYFAVETADKWNNISTISNVVSTRTLDNVPPSAPSGVSALWGDHRVDLSWSPNGESDFAGYNLYRSSFSMGYSTSPLNSALLSAVSWADTGLKNGVTMYYAVTAADAKGNESAYSSEVYAMPHDKVCPAEPAGVKGILSADGRTMTITWSSVTRNSDGSVIDDLAGYNVYKAPQLNEVYVFKGFVPADGALTWTDPDNIKGHVFYYMIKAKDSSYNTSRMSMIVDCSDSVNVIAANENDLTTYMTIPRKVSGVLYKETNKYGDDIKIEVTRNYDDEKGRALRVYTFKPEKGHTGASVGDVSFRKPLTEIVFSYKVENGYVKTASRIPESEASKRLAIFGFNGNEWIKLGGEVDEYTKTVRIKTKRLGKFMLKNSLRAVSFTIMAVYPDKIFTPNGDGWNDYFEITYENPADGMVNGKIYDMKGRFVKGMEKGSSVSEVTGSMKWDGRDSSGRLCPGGVYLYQIEITGPENKVINGTCVIAK